MTRLSARECRRARRSRTRATVPTGGRPESGSHAPALARRLRIPPGSPGASSPGLLLVSRPSACPALAWVSCFLPFASLRSIVLFVRGACRRHGQTSGAPLRKSFGKTPNLEPVSLQKLAGLIRVHAIRPATIGDHFAIAGQLGQASLELGNWNRTGAGDVALAVFELGAH